MHVPPSTENLSLPLACELQSSSQVSEVRAVAIGALRQAASGGLLDQRPFHPDSLEDVRLVLSELLGNPFKHRPEGAEQSERPPCLVHMSGVSTRNTVRIQVFDPHPEGADTVAERLREEPSPEAFMAALMREGSRGLLLVRQHAVKCGVSLVCDDTGKPTSKCVEVTMRLSRKSEDPASCLANDRPLVAA